MSEIPLPDISLDGRVIIMTGADRGLGRAMTHALASRGARVALASPETAGLEVVAGEVEAIAGADHALAVPTDITNLAACRELVARTLDRFGRLDVLVNNARRLHRGPGIPPEGNAQPFFETDPQQLALRRDQGGSGIGDADLVRRPDIDRRDGELAVARRRL
jgi:NAD(P)-dependent dehydrogenase (short-subunit alcohol dehydrogenase family)